MDLKDKASALDIWAVGVGFVISGNYFGWNEALLAGVGGCIVSMVLVSVMYQMLTWSLAEMTSALPFAGGTFSFARTSMGKTTALLVGLAEGLEYILYNSTVLLFIGELTRQTFGIANDDLDPLWWLLILLPFIALHLWGGRVLWWSNMALTILSLCGLAIFFVGSWTASPNWDKWAPYRFLEDGNGTRYVFNGSNYFSNVTLVNKGYFPRGANGIIKALPFAVWFYIGVEMLPFLSEDTRKPNRDVAFGAVTALHTLQFTAWLTFFCTVTIAPGTFVLENATYTFRTSLGIVLRKNAPLKVIAFVSLWGCLAGFFCPMFGIHRILFALGRAGYLPQVFSWTWKRRNTPWVAILTGNFLTVLVTAVVKYANKEQSRSASRVLLRSTVFIAVVSYLVDFVSYILLKIRLRHLFRPFLSPLSLLGPIIGIPIALITIVGIFIESKGSDIPVFLGIVGGWLFLWTLYFLVWGRKRIIQTPEEVFGGFLIDVRKKTREAGEVWFLEHETNTIRTGRVPAKEVDICPFPPPGYEFRPFPEIPAVGVEQQAVATSATGSLGKIQEDDDVW